MTRPGRINDERFLGVFMKTSALSGMINGTGPTRPVSDEKMEQVRELLFGEFEEETQQRVAALEARVRELEVDLHRRLDGMQARLEALAGEIDSNHLTTHQEIASGLQELSERVRRVVGG